MQKEGVLEGLGDLWNLNGRLEMEDKVLGYFSDVLWKEEPYMQKSIGQHIPAIFPQLSKNQFCKVFDIIKYMIDIKDENISNVWYEVLFEYIHHAPLDHLKNDVVEYISSKGDLSEMDRNRIYCSRLFGRLAERLTGSDIETYFLDQLVQMCQDTSHKVRMHMAQNIEIISKKIGLERSKETLAEELFQLLEDETKDVKQHALTTLVHLLDFFDMSFRKDHIVPRLVECVNNPPYDLYKTIIHHFGEIFWKISNDIQNNDNAIAVFKGFFVETCKDKNASVRQQCAYNFPAVLKSLGARRYAVSLHNSLKALCEDSDIVVRQRIAASFHHVAQILNKQKSAIMLKDMFLRLMKDKDQGVRDRLVANLSCTFTCFHESSLSSEQLFITFVQPLIDYEQSIRKCWRRMLIFFDNIELIGSYFRGEDIYAQFIPMMRRQLFEGTAPLKTCSARVLVSLARQLQNNAQQVFLFKNLTNELARGKSFWHRMTYLELSLHVMDKFSRNFFKQHMLDAAMQLSSDPVPNVRMKFCSLMPHIKRVLSPSSDVKSIARLKERSSFLTLDKDKDVQEAAKIAHDQMTAIEVEMARGNTYSYHARDDALDENKMREEQTWIDQEKEMEKSRRRMEVMHGGSTSGVSGGIASGSSSTSVGALGAGSTASSIKLRHTPSKLKSKVSGVKKRRTTASGSSSSSGSSHANGGGSSAFRTGTLVRPRVVTRRKK